MIWKLLIFLGIDLQLLNNQSYNSVGKTVKIEMEVITILGIWQNKYTWKYDPYYTEIKFCPTLSSVM